MAKTLIKGDSVVANEWKVLRLAEGESPEAAKLPFGNVLVPLAVWRARKWDLVRRHWDQGHLLGIWLGPKDDPAQLAADLAHFSAIGAVGRDYLHFLRRVGFDAFEVNDPESAIDSLDDFSDAYQTAADGRLPWFRRAGAPALAA